MAGYVFDSVTPLEVVDMAGQPCYMCSHTCVFQRMCVLRIDTLHYVLCSPACLNRFVRERTAK